MKKYAVNTPDYIAALSQYSKMILTPTFGLFYEAAEALPTPPPMPSVTDLQVAEAVLNDNGQYFWSIRAKTADELNAAADEAEADLPVAAIKDLLSKQVPTAEADKFATLFPAYRVGKAYAKDERFQHNGVVYEVINPKHTSQADWKPDQVPSEYRRVNNPAVILEWVQPTGSHNAFKIGDVRTWKGQTWTSQINANTTVPDGDVPFNRYWKPA